MTIRRSISIYGPEWMIRSEIRKASVIASVFEALVAVQVVSAYGKELRRSGVCGTHRPTCSSSSRR